MYKRLGFFQQLAELLTVEEGLKLTPYYCSERYPTIGLGQRIGPKDTPLDLYQLSINSDIAYAMMRFEIIKIAYEAQSHELIQDALAQCNAYRRAVLFSMMYQLGVTGLSKFVKTLTYIAKRDFASASTEMLNSKWAKQTDQRARSHSHVMKNCLWSDRYDMDNVLGLVADYEEYIVLDTETTGLGKGDTCIECAVVDDCGNVLFDELFKTDMPINPDAQDVHGITSDMLNDQGVDFASAFTKLCDVVKGKSLVIFNASFDLRMLKQTCKAHGRDFNLFAPRRVYCAMNDYADWWGEWNEDKLSYKWQSLSKAAEQQNVKVTGAHRAKNDCLVTLSVIKEAWARTVTPLEPVGEKLNQFQLTLDNTDVQVHVYRHDAPHENLIHMRAFAGNIPYATLTKVLDGDFPRNSAILDTNNVPGLFDALEANGVVKQISQSLGLQSTVAQRGFCEYPVVEFLKPELLEVEAES